MPMDEYMDMEAQRQLQEFRSSPEYEEAEQNQMFQYELPQYDSLNKAQKKEWKKADSLKKEKKKVQKDLDSLKKKLMKAKDPEENEKLEIKVLKERIKLEELNQQEQQKRLSVLPGQLAMKKKAELDSLGVILSLRNDLIQLYVGKGTLNEKEEADMLKQSEAFQRESRFREEGLRLHDQQLKLIIADTKEKKKEQREPASDAALREEFKNLPLVVENLQKEYVLQHMEECLHQVRLIQKMQEMKKTPEWKQISVKERVDLELKLDAVKEYTDHIRELFLENGMDILSDNLKPQVTAESISRRRSYLAGGRMRLEKAYQSYRPGDLNRIYTRYLNEVQNSELHKKTSLDSKMYAVAYMTFGPDWLKQTESQIPVSDPVKSVKVQMEIYKKLIDLMKDPQIKEKMNNDFLPYINLYQELKNVNGNFTPASINALVNSMQNLIPVDQLIQAETINQIVQAETNYIAIMEQVIQEQDLHLDKITQKQAQNKETILEQRLSALEQEFSIQTTQQEKIANVISRPKNQVRQSKDGEVKADFEDMLGTMNRFYEKSRLRNIFYTMKEKAKDPVFDSLEDYMDDYTGLFRQTKANRQEYEKKEGTALVAFQAQLSEVISQTTGTAQRYASLLQSLLMENMDGTLQITEQGTKVIHQDQDFYMGKDEDGYKRKWADRRDMPLFPHAPGIKDIEQGSVGDCYLLTGLSAVLSVTPERIRECMKDNGDGTVTVRFLDNDNPVYVTVSKTVPVWENGNDCYAQGSLWVQMMEKAYAASGLRDKTRKKDQLISYEDISGGHANVFIKRIMERKKGSVFQEHTIGQDAMMDIAVKNILDRIPSETQTNNWKRWATIQQSPQVMFVYDQLTSAERNVMENYSEYDPDVSKSAEVKRLKKKVTQARQHLSMINDVALAKGKKIEGIADAEELKNWIREIQRTIHKYREKPGSVDRFLRETLDQYPYDHFAPDEFDASVDVLIRRLDQHVKPVENDMYTAGENSTYNSISVALEKGRYVSFGTKKLSDKKTGRNGESERAGMVGTHAYTILGTKEQQIGGVMHKYFVVMNPWATKGVRYKQNQNDPSLVESMAVKDEQEEGVFLLDLRDFEYVTRHWEAVGGE